MTEHVKQKKVFSHVITVPPNTDIAEMGGAYKALLSGMGVILDKVDIPFAPNTSGFTHPIEECKNKLTQDFMMFMQVLQAAKNDYGDIHLDNMVFNAMSLIMSFFYME